MDWKLIAGGVAVFAAGVGTGVLATRQYFDKAYNQVAEDEIQAAREFYSAVHKKEYPTPGDAVKGLHPDGVDPIVDEAADALLAYQGKEAPEVIKEELEKPDGVERAERKHNNIFTDAEQIRQLALENRDPKFPYVITYQEYQDNPRDFDKKVLTFYAGDGKLTDDDDEIIELVDYVVGSENLSKFGIGSEDQNVVLVRNEKLRTDYEVTYSEGHFAREVLGLEIEKELEHSDGPRRRGRRRWDDD